MKDTSVSAEAKMVAMFKAKTPQERFKMGCSMHAFSKQLVVSALLRENPHLSGADLRKELFLRFYGDDFNPKHRQKIMKSFEQHS